MKVGIDFGTTNSAVARLTSSGPTLLPLYGGELVQRTVIHCSTEAITRYGNAAFEAYQEDDLSGRFIRSMKTFLSADVPSTTLGGRKISFDDLIMHYLRFLIEGAERVCGEKVTEVVLGRPVRFHADDSKDQMANDRLCRALERAGVERYRLQLEPIAAAHAYERELDGDRLVLVGDFGGGTSDFAVIRCGPSRVGRDRTDDVLATSGVPLAGDALDGRFFDRFLLPYFGSKATIRARLGDQRMAWNNPILKDMQRLYFLHQCRTDALLRQLDDAERRIDDVTAIRRVKRLVFDDLGYPMAWAIEAAKIALGQGGPALFCFEDFFRDDLNIERFVNNGEFEDNSKGILGQYDAAIELVLSRAGLAAADIDDVFLTGGTSQLVFVRGLFETKFSGQKIRGADCFTSVCAGLACTDFLS